MFKTGRLEDSLCITEKHRTAATHHADRSLLPFRGPGAGTPCTPGGAEEA